jgi:hypothetical protein
MDRKSLGDIEKAQGLDTKTLPESTQVLWNLI